MRSRSGQVGRDDWSLAGWLVCAQQAWPGPITVRRSRRGQETVLPFLLAWLMRTMPGGWPPWLPYRPVMLYLRHSRAQSRLAACRALRGTCWACAAYSMAKRNSNELPRDATGSPDPLESPGLPGNCPERAAHNAAPAQAASSCRRLRRPGQRPASSAYHMRMLNLPPSSNHHMRTLKFPSAGEVSCQSYAWV